MIKSNKPRNYGEGGEGRGEERDIALRKPTQPKKKIK